MALHEKWNTEQCLGEFPGKPSEPSINRVWNENNTPETESEPTRISIEGAQHGNTISQ